MRTPRASFSSRAVADGAIVEHLPMYRRFLAAMSTYAVLAVLATFTLDGKLRIVIWIVMGALALKTLIAYKAGW
jgi:hypothetical protein